MKVFIFLPSLAGGGAERTVVNLANQFANYGHHVQLVTGKEQADELRSSKYIGLVDKKVALVELSVPATIKKSLGIILGIRGLIKAFKPDVIFSTRLPANLITLISMIGIRNVGRVIIRESVVRSFTVRGDFKRWLVGLAYNRADKVISLSKGVAEDLIHEFGVVEDKVCVVYNPVDFVFIEDKKVRPIGQNDNSWPKCIFVGRFDDQKSPIEAVFAFEKIKLRFPGASLRMYGIGPLVSQVEDYITSRDSALDAKYCGFSNNPYAEFNGSDFFLMPSKYEGFGHVIVEALACNCLPLVYDCPHGPSEILTGELDKLLVPLGDWQIMAEKAVDLANKPDECKNLRLEGQKVIRKYDSSRIALEYLDIFKDTLN
jgi:glycosyltransferase involved in cell wall biosynthesis